MHGCSGVGRAWGARDIGRAPPLQLPLLLLRLVRSSSRPGLPHYPSQQPPQQQGQQQGGVLLPTPPCLMRATRYSSYFGSSTKQDKAAVF